MDLTGKKITSVEVAEDRKSVRLVAEDGAAFVMGHEQKGREHVALYGVPANIDDMTGEKLILARRDVQDKTPTDLLQAGFYCDDSFTWTSFTFATGKGVVVFRWLGTSRGGEDETAAIVADDQKGGA